MFCSYRNQSKKQGFKVFKQKNLNSTRLIFCDYSTKRKLLTSGPFDSFRYWSSEELYDLIKKKPHPTI